MNCPSDRGDVGVVGGRQAGQADLLVAGRLQDGIDSFDRDLRVTLPDRPIPDAGLAEPAASGAAAHDFDLGPIEDDAEVGHELADGSSPGLEVRRHAVGDLLGRGGVARQRAEIRAVRIETRLI